MKSADRQQFDEYLQQIISDLPASLQQLLEETPLIVEDSPDDRLREELGLDPATEDLCGLHWGVALTDRSVEQSGHLPDQLMIFRQGVTSLAKEEHAQAQSDGDSSADFRWHLIRQIRITLLHEIGHHFGLDEDDLAELGYA